MPSNSYRPWGLQPLCGCWYTLTGPHNAYGPNPTQRAYLPLNGMKVHTMIKDVASRTVLTQTFSNDSNEQLKNIAYSFPLYDGVSVVSFTATIGDVKIYGVVKEKQQARREYREAVDKGSKAGLLEQIYEASDTFVTRIGNVPAGSKVIVEIIYIGELKHDAEANGIRFTIPSFIAPRYGPTPNDMDSASILHKPGDAIEMVVDFEGSTGCPIQQIQSPSHPITVNIGRTSTMAATAHMTNCGSATLSLDTTVLDKDFVFIASIKDAGTPKALLETHALIPNQRALMATLVPRFNITPSYGEIVFIVDRSGSMGGKMHLVIKAMTILLKSLPVGAKFNICSFGSRYSFLWPRSKSYNDTSLNSAMDHINAFDADFGGTEIYQPVEATISQRYNDMLLDAIILTDGQIWRQESLFELIRKASADYNCRFFSLGIGSGASTARIEGIATAGNGFSQFVAEGEKMDTKMVRLLKGALTPHINGYSLEIKYKQDDDFEIIDSVREASKVKIEMPATAVTQTAPKPSISFFNKETDSEGDSVMTPATADSDRFAHLPVISPPPVVQAPYQIPPLYSASRTTVYILFDPSTDHGTPESIVLRATCSDGPLELEIKVEDIGKGEIIHQLAAKKAVSELEKDGGWLSAATDKTDNILVKNKYDGRWEEIVEREAVRLGVKYQIAGKWTSFIALEGDAEQEAVVVDAEVLHPYDPTLMYELGVSDCMNPGVSMDYSRRYRRARASALPISFGISKLVTRARARIGTAAASILSRRHDGDEDGDEDALEAPPRRPRRARTMNYKASAEIPHLSSAKQVISPTASSSLADSIPQASFAIDRIRIPSPTSSSIIRGHGVDLHGLVQLQRSDGSWDWDERLLDIIGTGLDPGSRDAVVATALAIAFLKKHGAHEAETWELIVQKAKDWLAQQHGVNVEKEISDAEKLLETVASKARPDRSR